MNTGFSYFFARKDQNFLISFDYPSFFAAEIFLLTPFKYVTLTISFMCLPNQKSRHDFSARGGISKK